MELEAVNRLTKDIKAAAKTLSHREARYLVDTYYQMQDGRTAANNRVRSMETTDEPHATLSWLAANASLLERNVARALDAYGDAHHVGLWSKAICGIGPIISAGLIANIDLEPWQCQVARATIKAKACRPDEPHGPGCHAIHVTTAGQIWRFAGLDPTVTWEKGQRRPWNASLKTLCWKLGECFIKVHNNEKDLYGHLIMARKDVEITRNDAGALADQAQTKLERFKIGKGTDAYKAYTMGRLPPQHIHARAKRWGVKLFLAHWHEAAFVDRYGRLPPAPYVFTQPGHAHELVPPNLDLVPGWREARLAAGRPV